jgi:hypothetical protein
MRDPATRIDPTEWAIEKTRQFLEAYGSERRTFCHVPYIAAFISK